MLSIEAKIKIMELAVHGSGSDFTHDVFATYEKMLKAIDPGEPSDQSPQQS